MPVTSTRTVVVGDIGGHDGVLDNILRTLDVSDDGRLVRGLTVIQVGDLVRAGSQFRSSNTAITERIARILDVNPSTSWIQLIGNHECGAIGGLAKAGWDIHSAFEPRCIDVLHRWWIDKRMVLAHAMGDTLVTHAGLTRGAWQALGSPQHASEAANILNAHAGKPLATFAAPGRLVTGARTLDADCMWAEVNTELLEPWLEAGDMPFHQIHGHASPFHWPAHDWWPETSQRVRDATAADQTLRRSTTRIPRSMFALTSVDWTLENESPDVLWPLLTYP